MDTSEKYIKMCEKATEIQKLVRDEPLKYLDGKDFLTGTIGDVNVWLPRQDQLQTMMGETKPPLYAFTNFVYPDPDYGEWAEKNEDIRQKQRQYVEGFSSFEQIWLAFIMFKKYNKTWTGEDWVNA